MAAIKLPFAVVPISTGTITAGNERTSNPASHLFEHKAPGLTWRSNGSGSLTLSGDFGRESPIDFLSIMAASAQATTKIRLRLGDSAAQAASASPAYDSGTIDFISPFDGNTDNFIVEAQGDAYALFHSHLELPTEQVRRYWRIDITGHTGDFEAAHLVLGKKITPARFYDQDFEQGLKDLGALEISRFGVVNEQAGLIFRTLKLKFGWISEDEYESMFRPLVEALGTRGVAFWCLDPAPTLYRQARTYFGWLTEPPFATGAPKPRTYSQDYSILSMF